MIPTTIGRYPVAEKLGQGGMGVVYRATDTRLRREIALKVLPPAFGADVERLARFEREAQVLASLNHPNIAQVYGFEHDVLPDGTIGHVLAMELVPGEDLAQRLTRGPLPLDDAIAVAMQIAEALEEAHERGIVHRDLKPGNVRITPDGKVKVLDFGLARSTGSDAARSIDAAQSPTVAHAGTEVGLILGTAAYMSPEQARGKPVDKRTDVWAFGAVLYEMLTGEQLFNGETITDVLAAAVRAPIDLTPLPAETPAAVRRLLDRCLDREPRRRLRDIGEARILLDEARTPGGPPVALVRPSGSMWRTTLPWALSVAALSLAAWALLSRQAAPTVSHDLVHLDVVFPPDAEPVAGRQGGIAIAPDGTAIAMVGFRNGQRRLFVRRLDSPDAVDVSGTSGGGVFSPDGRSVAFVNNATILTRLSLADGQARVLASGGDFVTGVNLAWSPTELFFVRGGSLWGVPPEGGDPRQVTALDPAQGEVLHADPLPLPGGRMLLFSRLTAGARGDRIESIPISGGPRTVVVENATTPVWSATGHLLFGRDGAVWAMPFDPETATPRGDAVAVMPAGIVGAIRTGSLGFQVSANGTLAFVPADFDSKRLVSVARDGAERPLSLPPGSYGNPRVSPDGRRVALERDGAVVETVDLVRGTRASIVAPAIGTNFPVWSSDGSRLLFRRYNLPYWAAADGSGEATPVANADAYASPASAGPDADTFIAIQLVPETAGDLYLHSLSGAFAPKPLVTTPAYEGSPHLSPDGRWLLYQSNATGQPEIYVRRYPDLVRVWQVSEGGGVQARWDPSGREIYYRGSQRLMSVAFDSSGAEPSLGKPRALFTDVYDFGQGLSIPNYDVTRDGRFVMLRRGTQGGTFRVVLNWAEVLRAKVPVR